MDEIMGLYSKTKLTDAQIEKYKKWAKAAKPYTMEEFKSIGWDDDNYESDRYDATVAIIRLKSCGVWDGD